MESLADLPLDLNDDEELERDDEDNEDLDSDMVEINHEDGDKSANETEDADKKKTPIWRKPQKKKGGKKGGGGKQKSKAANKKKDTKATGDNATSTDAQGTNQNVGRRFRGKISLFLNFHSNLNLKTTCA